MTIAAAADANRFRLGHVVSETARLYTERFVAIALAVIVLRWLPTVAFHYAAGSLAHGTASLNIHSDLYGLLDAGIAALTGGLFSVCVAQIVLGDQSRSLGAFARSLGDSIKLIPAIIPLSLITGAAGIILPLSRLMLSFYVQSDRRMPSALGLVLGALTSVLLLVLTAALFGVAHPVLAEERSGVLNTLRRSFNLLAGHRWSYMALWVVFAMALAVVLAAQHAVIDPALRPFPMFGAFSAILLATDLFVAVGTVMIAASYRELTRIKDGRRPADIASVFD
jgi:hypothetical protein